MYRNLLGIQKLAPGYKEILIKPDFGFGLSYVEGNYAQNTVDTYYGEAMAVVRAGEAGSVKITVSDEERTYTCEIPIVALK